jgi:galactokinase
MRASDMTDPENLRAEFTLRFGAQPSIFRAPGRVNLIGEHTDYNAGFVMPAAIRFYTSVAIAPRSDRTLRVRSLNFAETREVELPAPGATEGRTQQGSHWIDYVCGVAWALQDAGIALGGADMLIHGDVPLGAGLSSSAALEVASALALSRVAGLAGAPAVDGLSLARICQRAENQYVGMRCGIMDQFAAVHGRAGHAVLLDCRSLEHRYLSLHPACAAGHLQHHGAPPARRKRIQSAPGAMRTGGTGSLAQHIPGIEALRDVTGELLNMHEKSLDPLIYRRCRHVVTENERVTAAAARSAAADLRAFGRADARVAPQPAR